MIIFKKLGIRWQKPVISETWGRNEVRLRVSWSEGRGAQQGLLSLSEVREQSWATKAAAVHMVGCQRKGNCMERNQQVCRGFSWITKESSEPVFIGKTGKILIFTGHRLEFSWVSPQLWGLIRLKLDAVLVSPDKPQMQI